MKEQLEPYSEETARIVARVMGEHCASAKALKELDERRQQGETCRLYLSRKRGYVVVERDNDST